MYLLLTLFYHFEFQTQFDRVVVDRKLHTRSTSEEKIAALCESYCKVEFQTMTGFQVFVIIIFAYTTLVQNFLFPNSTYLPMNIYIWFLPFEVFSWQWAVTYVFQLSTFFSAGYFLIFFPLTLILMNHTCLLADIASIKVEDFRNELKSEISDYVSLRNVIEATEYVVTWQSPTRKLLRISFFAGLAVLSLFFCMCLQALAADIGEAFYIVGPVSSNFVQLYIYCWMGTRIQTRYQKLHIALYDLDWTRLNKKQRKDIQMVLMMWQKIKGYDAVFKTVDFSLLQKVGL